MKKLYIFLLKTRIYLLLILAFYTLVSAVFYSKSYEFDLFDFSAAILLYLVVVAGFYNVSFVGFDSVDDVDKFGQISSRNVFNILMTSTYIYLVYEMYISKLMGSS